MTEKEMQKAIINKLDKWIEHSEQQAERFRENKLIASEMSFLAMALAYSKVKSYIEKIIK